MTVALAKKISFPKIAKVDLENFDLYSRQSNIEISVIRDVFCLIGANGLGKSTFLNTLLFGITGAVPNPARKFQSAQDYYQDAMRADRASDYFDGRIAEASRPIARAVVTLSWPSMVVEVTREIFENPSIVGVKTTDLESGEVATFPATEDEDPNRLRKRFEDLVLRLTGLNDFAQFIFLWHFVLTFDEGRHLLMWDDGALTNVLYLAFGADPAKAQAADKLQREMDRESSRGRNVRFSARHVAERIAQLTKLLKGQETDDHTSRDELHAKYNALLEHRSGAEQRLRDKQSELRDADVAWTGLSASLTEVQLEYRKLFSARLQKSSAVEHHPVVRASISEDRCAICGTVHIKDVLRAAISASQCPLCHSAIQAVSSTGETISRLQELDAQIISIRNDLTSVLSRRERLSVEVTTTMDEEAAAASAVATFEKEEGEGLAAINLGGSFSAIQEEIQKLEKERLEFLRQSEAHYKKRDDARSKLRVYEKELKAQYEVGAEQFVPRFRELAEEFIGLPIDVELEHRVGANNSGFGLRLRMDEQVRSRPEKLSESQRFFIDIALRMALAEFMALGPATLLIDTPEGSLDIAYEARAGAMFSRFVESDNVIVMTANLRSSQLVLRLAELRHHAGMQIVRMTDWTDLSKVQQAEEQLFVRAYQQIDTALQRE